MSQLDQALVRRFGELTKTARMWGSPDELEAVAHHFSHVLLALRSPGWTFEQTHQQWRGLGAPLADDADEHAAMRSMMWGENEAQAQVQVVQGFVVVWAGLARLPDREAALGPWLEALLDGPDQAGTPDRLNMVLFSLMGFVAADPLAYVRALALERYRIGGHELRPLPVVAPAGPSDAGLTYTRNFQSWPKVIDGIGRMRQQLEASPAGDDVA